MPLLMAVSALFMVRPAMLMKVLTALRTIFLSMSGMTRSRTGRFGNRGSPIELTPAAKNSQIRASNTVNVGRNGGWFGTDICFKDDTLDTGPSVVEVVIANGPGYTVHPEWGRIEFTITDNDNCAAPVGTPGGVVYKESGCRCATESLHPSVRRHGSQTTTITRRDTTVTYTQPEEAYQQTLSNLASHFSDPSYLYCPESPWKGLP